MISLLDHLARARACLHADPHETSERLLDALRVVAELHAPRNVLEYCPASFGEPCPRPGDHEHRTVNENALVHAEVVADTVCSTCVDADNQPVPFPCTEHQRVAVALAE